MFPLKIKAKWIRGGTSKGLFFDGQDIKDFLNIINKNQKSTKTFDYKQQRDKLLSCIMGSPDKYKLQMDGIGGGSSSTSKIVIIEQSKRQDCDVDYEFGAVSIENDLIDYSGNCGNLTAAVGLYAIYSNLVKKQNEQNQQIQQNIQNQQIQQNEQNGVQLKTVRIWQKNTQQIILTHIKCDIISGLPLIQGDFQIDGISTSGSEIKCEFLKPGEGENSFIFSTQNVIDILELQGKYKGFQIQATLVNAGNPTVFIRSQDIIQYFTQLHSLQNIQNFGESLEISNQEILDLLEHIRCIAAIKMNLGNCIEQISKERPSTPKISYLSESKTHKIQGDDIINENEIDIIARILSMGKLHHAFTATGAIALCAAASVPGTIVNEIIQRKNKNFNLKDQNLSQCKLVFGHRSGKIDISSNVLQKQILNQKLWTIQSVYFSRTARIIMDGYVYVPPEFYKTYF